MSRLAGDAYGIAGVSPGFSRLEGPYEPRSDQSVAQGLAQRFGRRVSSAKYARTLTQGHPVLKDIQALGIAFQNTAELDLALELIEMRYQDHLAREDLQALFEAGALCGP